MQFSSSWECSLGWLRRRRPSSLRFIFVSSMLERALRHSIRFWRYHISGVLIGTNWLFSLRISSLHMSSSETRWQIRMMNVTMAHFCCCRSTSRRRRSVQLILLLPAFRVPEAFLVVHYFCITLQRGWRDYVAKHGLMTAIIWHKQSLHTCSACQSILLTGLCFMRHTKCVMVKGRRLLILWCGEVMWLHIFKF